jgi:hypothetical protein
MTKQREYRAYLGPLLESPMVGEACFANRGKAKTNYDRWQHH